LCYFIVYRFVLNRILYLLFATFASLRFNYHRSYKLLVLLAVVWMLV